MKAKRFASYEDFWLHYLREHARVETRQWHYLGTAAAIVCLAAFVATLSPWFLAGAVVAGYGPAWYGHAAVESNRPATFSRPLWSLISDFRMFFAWIGGSLDAELARAGVPVRRRRS
jgi:hypothetical protein